MASVAAEIARRLRGHRHPRSMALLMLEAMFAGVLLVTAIDFAWQYREIGAAVSAARNRALGRVAAGYLQALRREDADITRIPPSVFHEELGSDSVPLLTFRVSDERNALLGGDASLPLPPPSMRLSELAQPQYYVAAVRGVNHCVAIVRDLLTTSGAARPVIVQVAEPLAARVDAVRQAMLRIALRDLVRFSAVMLIAALAIRVGHRPLGALSRELRSRQPKDLSLAAADWPRELEPLVSAMNQLLDEQRQSVDQQQKFLTDASHQLRTPIAVLKTLVQGTLFGQADAADSLPRMLAVIDRTSGLTDQLLSLAKTEQLVRRADWQDVALEGVAKGIAVDFAPLIARKRLDFSLQAGEVVVHTDGWLLGELVKNLVANAIHHSPPGGAIGVVVRRLHDDAEMIVWDHGKGVDEGVLERLFEPFNVAKGSSGIGLGLSICRQIADSMNATVHLFNRVEGGETVGVDAVVRWKGIAGRAASTHG